MATAHCTPASAAVESQASDGVEAEAHESADIDQDQDELLGLLSDSEEDA
jgi:hypothetical protein